MENEGDIENGIVIGEKCPVCLLTTIAFIQTAIRLKTKALDQKQNKNNIRNARHNGRPNGRQYRRCRWKCK
jgi:hypothetical protein